MVASFNEQSNLQRCLDSISSIADEIIIVDGGSTDDTIEIAKSFKSTIIHTDNPPMFHINKQKGLDAATGVWILQLDADEAVSPELAKEIKQTIELTDNQIKARHLSLHKSKLFAKHQQNIISRDGNFFDPSQPIAGFFIARSNMFLGRAMKYAGMYPDGVIRLVKNGKAHFPCKSVHEQIQIQGDIAWLEHDLIHHDSPTFEKYIVRANRYTTLTAVQMKKDKLPVSFANHLNYLLFKPLVVFVKLYVRHKGFLDGFPGFVFSLFSGLHFTLAYMKHATDQT